MSKLSDLRAEVYSFISNISNGDKHLKQEPLNEKGLQFDLYQTLKKKGYNVVYELELPKLKPYLDELCQVVNEVKTFGHEKDSLVPDLVVNLGDEGFACFELKYNQSETAFEIDGKKCRVYVEQCSDVHYAGYINVFRDKNDNRTGEYCRDKNYKYRYYYHCDTTIDEHKLSKSSAAYSIKSIWEQRNEELRQGKGEFAKYEY